jgi:fibronectin-binding autotransporter adhesin
MKLRCSVPVLPAALFLTITASASPVVKSPAGTDLADPSSWGGTTPGPGNVATWGPASLGADLTLNSPAAWQGIQIDGALSNLTVTGNGLLNLGEAGITLSPTGVSASFGHPIHLAADQTWQAATGKSLTLSGTLSGDASLTVGAIAPTATYASFLQTTAVTAFPNTQLSAVTSISGLMGGAFVNNNNPLAANPYFFTNDGTTASCQLQIVDGGHLKCVKIEFNQVGNDVTARAIYAKYILNSSALGTNFDTTGTTNTIATTKGGAGYGAESTTLLLGTNAVGPVILSGTNPFTGPTQVSTTLRATSASVPGVGGPFGLHSAITLNSMAGSSLDLNGYPVEVGSITGGSAAGGGITLGAGTLTFGGDHSSPEVYSGRITGSGGIVKTGSGIQTFNLVGQLSSGGVTVDEGTLRLVGIASFDAGFFSPVQTYTINENGVLEFNGDWLTKSTSTYNVEGGTLAFTKTTGDTSLSYVNQLNLNNGTVAGPGTYRIGNNSNATHTFSGDDGNLISSGFGMVRNGPTQNVSLLVNDGLADDDLTITSVIYDIAGYAGSNLIKLGAGTLVVTGQNTYSGPTTLVEGVLQVGDGGATGRLGSGPVTNDATLVFNRTDTTTFANTLTGNGQLIQQGDGTLTLTGSKTHTGPTIINAGILDAATNLSSSPITVNDGGTLAGNAVLGTVTVRDGGIIDAGLGAVGDLLPDTLNLDEGAVVNVRTDSGVIDTLTLNVNGPVSVRVVGGGRATGSFPLIRYGTSSANPADFQLEALPPRVTAAIANNPGTLTWELNVTAVDRPRWIGAVSGIWDLSALNWREIASGNNTAYLQGDDVLFDDVATGTTAITLNAAVEPHSVTFDNSLAKDYSVSGFGSINGGTSLTKTNTGQVLLDTYNEFTGPVSILGGTLTATSIENSGVPSSIGAGSTLEMDSATLVFTGSWGTSNRLTTLGAGGAIIHSDGILTLSAPVAGPGGLVKSGSGDLNLNAPNAYAGGSTVSSGRLTTTNTTGFGNGPIVVGDADTGAQDVELILANRADIANAITVSASGTGAAVLGADTSGAGANAATFAGPITLNRPTTFLSQVVGDRLAIDGIVSGNVGTLTFDGGSRVTLGSTLNNFSGDLVITGFGTVLQASVGSPSEVIPDSANITIGEGAILQLAANGGGAETINALDGVGIVRTFPTASFGSRLVVGAAGGSGTFSGNLLNGFAPLAITKTGTGSQMFSGENTYTGTTIVAAGTLAGTGAPGSDFSILESATLAPGTAEPGVMTVKSATFEAGSTLAIRIDSSTMHSDTLAANGNVNLTGASLTVDDIDPTPLANNPSFVLVDCTGHTLSGTFNGLPEGAALSVAGQSFTITYEDARVLLTASSGATGFAAWAATNAPGQTVADDHDGDGVPNGVEYFMGLNGNSFTANPGLAANGTISWPMGVTYRGVYGTDFVVETSAHLNGWKIIPAPDVVIGPDQLTYQLDSALAPIFVRLTVMGP